MVCLRRPAGLLRRRRARRLEIAVSTLQLAPLAWRRSRPGASAAVVVAGHLLQLVLVPTLLPSQVAVPITVYALAAYGRRWQSFAGLGTGLAGALLATGRYVVLEGTAAAAAAMTLLAMALVVVVAWTFGDLHRTRLTATRALEDRAHRLEIERQQERDLAAADERSRIAREMHDIVAHSLSIVITQADGARYASATDPEVARHALATIAETGRASLREMRRLLGVLRGDEQSSTRPLPRLADLPDLVASARTAGLAVDFAVTGEPRRRCPPARSWPPIGPSRRRSPTRSSTPARRRARGWASAGRPRACRCPCSTTAAAPAPSPATARARDWRAWPNASTSTTAPSRRARPRRRFPR